MSHVNVCTHGPYGWCVQCRASQPADMVTLESVLLSLQGKFQVQREEIQRLTEERDALLQRLEATASDRDTFHRWALKSDEERDALKAELNLRVQLHGDCEVANEKLQKQLEQHTAIAIIERQAAWIADKETLAAELLNQKQRADTMEAALRVYGDDNYWSCGILAYSCPDGHNHGPDLAKAALEAAR